MKNLENEALALSAPERADLAKLILASLDHAEQQCIMEEMKKCNRNINHFAISPWLQQAQDDLGVAKTETVPSFIRCYHAQQAMEKMLKTAFVVVNGKFHNNSQVLIAERKNFKVNVPGYVPNCAWELNKGINFPCTHNLLYLWKKLGEYDPKAFGLLNDDKKQLMKKASECAVEYRYPYFSKNVGLQVSYMPDNDVQEIVKEADVLCTYC